MRERERAWRLKKWLGFRIFAFYTGVLGRRFCKNRRLVFSKSSAKMILADDFWSRRPVFWKSSPKILYLGDDVLHYKSRRPRWRKSSAKSSIIKFRISWFWWSEKRNWKPTVRYDQHNELRRWEKIQLHLTKIRARSVRSIGAVKPLNGRKRLFDPPNHVIWPDLQLRIVSNRRDSYGAIKIW